MWTRLVAGAAAHDINNLTQGLYNLLSLGASPGASAETLTRYVMLAREGIKQLQDLGRDLRTLADIDPTQAPQRLEVACADALLSIEPTLGRTIVTAEKPAQPVLVVGSAAALRLAIQAVVRYALAASAAESRVLVRVAVEGDRAVLFVDAPTAPAPHASREGALDDLMLGAERAFASDVGLVLAGAALSICAGEVRAAAGPDGGIRFKLCLRRADARRSDAGPS
jgi:hypothetical protein